MVWKQTSVLFLFLFLMVGRFRAFDMSAFNGGCKVQVAVHCFKSS